ncbi:MAG: prolyl oligopeptidase family serine peptidase [Verrucomicrobiia bacterium]
MNGEIRGGDSYGFGFLRLPVALHEGTNHFLFQSGRGDLRAKLIPAPGALSLHTADSTLPDLIMGEADPVWGATVLINATTNFVRAALRVQGSGESAPSVTIPPLGIHKAPFLLRPLSGLPETNRYSCQLEALELDSPDQPAAVANVELRVRRPDQSHVRTFISELDGSVQYYAVNPAFMPQPPGVQPALFLSLHGAGVEARGQAEAYSPKRWGHIVAPTNRRPYGFDWEEWGRWDALEVLNLAKARYQTDPHRVYLTGHSMGGHGTWQLGVLFPDKFAAIGPSAGWISFSSYANRNAPAATNAVQEMLQRAAAASDTLLMATNYLQQGVYILHGDADDNVPVTQARRMREVLETFHRDLQVFEQPGAGHWWDASDEPGTDYVDWAPMFDLFARRTIPVAEALRHVRFVTVNPAVSSRAHWVAILSQQRSLEPSAVDLRCDPRRRRVVGITTNVSHLWLEFPSIIPGADLTIELDGQKLEALPFPRPADRRSDSGQEPGSAPGLCLVLENGTWRVGEYPSGNTKSPDRSGPFREAFRNDVLLVYATQGTPAENAWTLAKARFDSETFYYRGNGSFEMMADSDVIAGKAVRRSGSTAHGRVRNLILYGHSECNAAWQSLLANSPVQVSRNRLRVGDRDWSGADVGCLFLRPHPQDSHALVGVVAGTGMAGLRVTERMPYFVSGAGFPDCLVFRSDLPSQGAEGILAAGFFGPDWGVSMGQFAWAKAE